MSGKYDLKAEKKDRVVVMSDLHLGEEECVLNNDDFASSDFKYLNRRFYSNNLKTVKDLKEKRKKNLANLREELNKLGEIDELILLGDIFDFSLASIEEAYNNARRFFGAIFDESPAPPIKEITYIAGNHDHHQWSQIFERYVVTNNIKNPPDRNEYLRWFVDQDATAAFPANLRKTFLNDLLPVGSQTTINVRYPHAMREVGGKNYYLTHGHYLQKTFRPVGQLIRPHSLGELEAFNCLWLEAVWYNLGQAGRLSFIIERIYEPRKDDEVFWEELDKVIGDILFRIGPSSFFLRPISWIGKWGLKRYIMSSLKRGKGTGDQTNKDSLKDIAKSDLRDLDTAEIRDDVRNYIKNDLLQFVKLSQPFTFVYGHTHKTTGLKNSKTMEITIEISGKEYPLENTGAWLEEGKEENAGFFVIDNKGLRWIHMPVT